MPDPPLVVSLSDSGKRGVGAGRPCRWGGVLGAVLLLLAGVAALLFIRHKRRGAPAGTGDKAAVRPVTFRKHACSDRYLHAMRSNACESAYEQTCMFATQKNPEQP